MKEISSVENTTRADIKRLISERMERKIVRDVSKNPELTTKDIVKDTKTTEFNASTKIVTRCLGRIGLVQGKLPCLRLQSKKQIQGL